MDVWLVFPQQYKHYFFPFLKTYSCKVSLGFLQDPSEISGGLTSANWAKKVWPQQEVLIFKGLAAKHNNAYLWLVWAWPRKPATFRHANCRVVCRKGVVARGEGSVSAVRHVWLYVLSALPRSLSHTLTVCIMHITSAELKRQTFIILLNRPQNTGWKDLWCYLSSMKGFFPPQDFVSRLSEKIYGCG